MSRSLILILGDQLSRSLSALQGFDKSTDTILMAEVREEATYVKHHKKKIIFLFSAMRHFAKQLSEDGYRVVYRTYDDPENKGSLFEEVKTLVKTRGIENVVTTFPGEFRVLEDFRSWSSRLKLPVEIREDDRFLCSLDTFSAWASDRKQLRMEYFYREMRKTFGHLMEGGKPIGGKWNYDSNNRACIPDGTAIPSPTTFEVDAITRDVIALVNSAFSDHFGSSEHFHYAVTREQALVVLDVFVDERLQSFGDYQDAMKQDEPWLFHAHIGLYLNAGLLLPSEVIQRAEVAYAQGRAPLNCVEGFIRQVLGWREYVRGLYWYKMPGYASQNYLEANRSLPDLFWGADTRMNCLRQCVKDTYENAYAHHIQRLMVLGNFALLAGLSPQEVNEWYLIVYADAYEWVEMPNVSGMVLFADGGVLASKPYAASGAYINKMSNYCQHCEYSVKEKHGAQACPFNYLYWGFLSRNRHKLEGNPRLGMPYRTLNNMSDDKLAAIDRDNTMFFNALDNDEKV